MDAFIVKSKALFPGRFDYSLIQYSNNPYTPVTLVCLKHSEAFSQSPVSHFNELMKTQPKRSGCRSCKRDQFITEAKAIHGDKYDYSRVSYISQQTNVEIICSIHQSSFFQSPYKHVNIAHRCGCPTCGSGGGTTSNTTDFVTAARKVHGDLYDYTDVEYIVSREKVKIRCIKHGIVFEQRPASHLVGHGCSICKESKLERATANVLESLGASFKREFRLICVDIVNARPRSLRVDFQFSVNNETCFIETDGKQHFEVGTLFNRDAPLHEIIHRDRCKNLYCKNNNINLLRISYKELTTIPYWINQFISQVKQSTSTVFMVSNPTLYNSQRISSKRSLDSTSEEQTKKRQKQ